MRGCVYAARSNSGRYGVGREHLVEQRLGLVEVEVRRERRVEQERVQRRLAVAAQRRLDECCW